jgi:hypothetical protein
VTNTGTPQQIAGTQKRCIFHGTRFATELYIRMVIAAAQKTAESVNTFVTMPSNQQQKLLSTGVPHMEPADVKNVEMKMLRRKITAFTCVNNNRKMHVQLHVCACFVSLYITLIPGPYRTMFPKLISH